ncbi:MAG: hypothetical protein ABEN55_22425, partial [Bradymonadaceae bacterium]
MREQSEYVRAACALVVLGVGVLVLVEFGSGCRRTRGETAATGGEVSPQAASESKRLAATARQQLEQSPMLGLLLAREAVEVAPTSEAKKSLRAAIRVVPHRTPISNARTLPKGEPVGPPSLPLLVTGRADHRTQVSKPDGTDATMLEEAGPDPSEVAWAEDKPRFAVAS